MIPAAKKKLRDMPNGSRLQSDPLGLEPIPDDTRQRFLRFPLAGKSDALLPLVDITAVLQLELADILAVPEMADYLLGVYNWRGEMLWLVDINVLCGHSPLWCQRPGLERPTVIVIQSEQSSLGLVVEHVNDVELIAPETIHDQVGIYDFAATSLVIGHLPDHGGIVLDVAMIVMKIFQIASK